MVTQNHRFLTFANWVKPDGQCLTVFFTAMLTTGMTHSFDHLHLINDASANIGPITYECNTVAPPTPLLQKEALTVPPAAEESSAAQNQASKVATIEEPKFKPVARKSKPVANKPVLRMRVIGAQDGTAWIVSKSGEVSRVAVGDVVPGIGKIGVIRSDRTIRTTDGQKVFTGMED